MSKFGPFWAIFYVFFFSPFSCFLLVFRIAFTEELFLQKYSMCGVTDRNIFWNVTICGNFFKDFNPFLVFLILFRFFEQIICAFQAELIFVYSKLS